jgi:hypothetical protein
MIVLRGVLGLLLVAHGLVHLLYLAADVPEFSIDRSWLVPKAWRRPVAATLMGATVVGFTLLGLAVWGVPGLRDIWPMLAIAASSVSALVMVAFFHPRLLLGLTIDAAIIAVAITQPAWTQTLTGAG